MADHGRLAEPVPLGLAVTFPWAEAARRAVPLMAAKVVNFAMTMACFALAARYLGPERFGFYSLAYTLPWLLLPVVDFGVTPVVTREIAAGASLGWARTGVLASLMTVPVALGLLFGGCWVAGLRGRDLLLVAVGSVQLFAFAVRPAEAVLVATKRTTELGIASVCANVLSLVGVVWATQSGQPETVVLGAHAGYTVVYAVLTVYFGRGALLSGSRPAVPALWHEAWPFGAGSLAGSLTERSGIPLLLGLLGAGPAGLYGAAFRVYEVAVAAAGAGALVVRPFLAEAASNPRVLVQRSEQLLKGALALSGGGALCIAGVAPELMAAIYGSAFREAAVALLGLTPALANVLPGNVAAETGIVARKRSSYLIAACAASLVSVLGTAAMGPQVGLLAPGASLGVAGTVAIIWVAASVSGRSLTRIYTLGMFRWCVLLGLLILTWALPFWFRLPVALMAGVLFARDVLR